MQFQMSQNDSPPKLPGTPYYNRNSYRITGFFRIFFEGSNFREFREIFWHSQNENFGVATPT